MNAWLIIAMAALMIGQPLCERLVDALIANWPLAVVGIAGVWAALRTLNTIKRQADISDSYTRPSLHIDGVRVIQFEPEHQPIFFVKIINSGLLAAKNVSISMKVAFADSTSEYNQDQVMTIPAKDGRECFIDCALVLNSDVMRGFDRDNKPLCISGHVIWNKETTEYCYKYNPWPFDTSRPHDLPLFVTCDFDPRRTVGISGRAMGHASVQASGSLVARKTTPGSSKDPT